MLKTIAFQAKKIQKKSKIFIFVKLLHIIRDGSEMVPECVLGPEASQKASGMVIQRFEKISENRLLDSKNQFFETFWKFEHEKHDFRSFSNSIGSFDMNAYIKQTKGSVQRDQNKIFVEPIFI